MPRRPIDEELDEALEGTFPASDPPSLTEPLGDHRRRRPDDEKEEPEE
jgi:hypothetical protein